MPAECQSRRVVRTIQIVELSELIRQGRPSESTFRTQFAKADPQKALSENIMDLQVDILARDLYLEFSNWNLTYMKDIWTLRPGFYSEFRYKSREHSGLAWGAILRKVFVFDLISNITMFIFPGTCSQNAFFP